MSRPMVKRCCLQPVSHEATAFEPKHREQDAHRGQKNAEEKKGGRTAHVSVWHQLVGNSKPAMYACMSAKIKGRLEATIDTPTVRSTHTARGQTEKRRRGLGFSQERRLRHPLVIEGCLGWLQSGQQQSLIHVCRG
jgi:hypothetical protein